ncbi:MAG: type I DNA topoisomerase [Lentisphaeria bacterium]
MSQMLVIVESPTKARTINRFIGKDAEVMACMGHVRDLPTRSIGVDIADHFKPRYVLTPSGKKTIAKLKDAARQADTIYLATDPDREGEAIAWHLEESLKKTTGATFRRATFHEITRAAIEKAFDNPEKLDFQKVDAQQARRILDRLVGYKISPLLWKHIQKGTSAGRVQSVALRMVCERERAIQAFEPEEYWNLTARFLAQNTDSPFQARLVKLDGEKPVINDATTANALADELGRATFSIATQRKRKKRQRPSPPFITSTLQQSAGSAIRFSARQTMQIAQQLYEGVDTGEGEAAGLITYMRTDSVAVSKEAQNSAAQFIKNEFGSDYSPSKPNRYRSGKGAQEAHEAIRPTDVTRTPEKMAHYLNAAQFKLYRLIWTRFVASQMTPAQLLEHTVEVQSAGQDIDHSYLFRATETKVVFPGFKKVYDKLRTKSKPRDQEQQNQLPELPDGTPCTLQDLEKEQKFTEPPKRFTEATLVRELEQKGVGRPSTYATIVYTIQKRSYVNKERGSLRPTDLGFSVNDYLIETVPQLFQVQFTAEMESELDSIEEGKLDSTTMLEHFYEKFRSWIKDVELIAAPEEDTIKSFLSIFPETIEWQEPQKLGRQTFDDKKFFLSLSDQALKKGKKLSDKQWQALLALAARYADQIPELWKKAEELGITSELKLLYKRENEESSKESAAPAPAPQTVDLLAALQKVNQWEEPRKRGKRTFDDKAFYESLRDQVNGGKALSHAQKKVLQTLVAKYREQIPEFSSLMEKYNVAIPEKKETIDQNIAVRLTELLGEIKEWKEPQKRGRRTYDDKKFADSLRQQVADKGTLTVRQANAARKVLFRYKDQISKYDELAAELDLQTESSRGKNSGSTGTKTGEKCPECGGELLLRHSKRGPFYGCSKFPKCRFTKAAETGKKDKQE